MSCNISLPNGNVTCVEEAHIDSGNLRFYGVLQSSKQRFLLIVVNTKDNEVVRTLTTKMRTLADMTTLLSHISGDRHNGIFRPFEVYANAWVSKKDKAVKIPKRNQTKKTDEVQC